MIKKFKDKSPQIIYSSRLVPVKWGTRNKKYYTKIGYIFTNYGDTIYISPEKVMPGSSAKVEVVCPLCKNKRLASKNSIIKAGHSYCQPCSNTFDLTGEVFGSLLVKKYLGNSIWLCFCSLCGKCSEKKSGNLDDTVISCGCYMGDYSHLGAEVGSTYNFIDISQKRFGRLVAKKYLGDSKWLCKCDCGKVTEVYGSKLRNGHTKSCGCLRKEMMTGSTSPRWNTHITQKERIEQRNYTEYTKWRSSVYARDNYMCVVCGDSTGGNLVAHHLNDYSTYKKYRTVVENGVTLCESCHYDFHYNFMGNQVKSCTSSDFDKYLKSK